MIFPKRISNLLGSATFASIVAILPEAHALELITSDGPTLNYFNQQVIVDENFILTSDQPTLSGFKVIITNPSNGDTLDFDRQAGIDGGFDNGGSGNGYVLTLRGTASVADYQAALRTVRIRTSTSANDRVVLFTAETGNSPAVYNENNGHYYQLRNTYPTGGSDQYNNGGTVSCGGSGYYERNANQEISWREARAASAQFSYSGLSGYLATITSQAESNFIANNFSGNTAWIGASDDPDITGAAQGDWQWATGPEAGTLFWQEVDGTQFNSNPNTGSPQNGEYSNWRSTGGSEEPNNYTNEDDSPADGESFAAFVGSQGGTWNDMPNIGGYDKICSYIVEFGGMPGESLPSPSQKIVAVSQTNTPPNSANKTVTTLESTAYNFVETDFEFSDPDGIYARFDHITVRTVPRVGSLTLNTISVNEQQNIPKAQIANLVFTPISTEHGAAYDSFDFTVHDTFNDSRRYTMTIDVTSVNDAPVINHTIVNDVSEGSAVADTVLLTFSATDLEDGTVTDRVLVTNSDGYYSLSSNQVTLTSSGAALINGGYALPNVELSVTDFEDGVGTSSIAITSNLINDPPILNTTAGAAIQEQTVASGDVVLTFNANDQEDGNITSGVILVDNDSGYYTINASSVILTVAGANFVESGKTLPNVHLSVTDANGLSDSTDNAVITTLFNDTPRLILNLTIPIEEGAASSATIVASFVATDEEDTPLVSFTAGTNTNAYYEIAGGNISLTPKGANFVNAGGILPSVDLTVTDAQNDALTDTKVQTPVVILVNDTPEIRLNLGEAVEENSAISGMVVATYIATDEEGTPIVDFTSGSNSDAYYEIVDNHVQLTQVGADFVNSGGSLPRINLTATDDADDTVTASASAVPVTNIINDRPTIAVTLGNDVVEGTATDTTVVATFVAADEEGTPLIDFTNGTNTEGYYEIVDNTIELTQAGADHINGGGTLPAVSLTATDDEDNTLTAGETKLPGAVYVNDIPYLSLALGDAVIEDNASQSTIVASYSASDEDGTPIVSFTTNTNSDGYYTIIGTDVTLSQIGADFVNTGGVLPAVNLTATDDADSSITVNATQTPVTTHVNDAPELSLTLSSTIVEDQASDASIVAIYAATDEDGTPTVDFTNGSNSNSYYDLVGNNVELTQIGADFVNTGGTLPNLSLTATDDTDTTLTATAAVTPKVTFVNDAPQISLSVGADILENSATNTTIVATFAVSDEDGTPITDFTADTNNQAYYKLIEARVELTQDGADFVNGGGQLLSFSLTATDSDDAALIITTDPVTPVITPVNDSPVLTLTLGDSIVVSRATDGTVVASFIVKDEDGIPSIDFTVDTNAAAYYRIVGNNIELTLAGADFANAANDLPLLSLTTVDDADPNLSIEKNVQPLVLLDTDLDGIPNDLDTDDDGDGISDTDEGDIDSDNDGIPNSLDPDSDNDGISDRDEGLVDSDGDTIPDFLDTSLDEDGDGIPDIVEGIEDADGDGIPNFRDIDSDGDGLIDSEEAEVSGKDTDNDGIDDTFDIDQTNGVDLDSDGIDDSIVLLDSDKDRLPNYLDKDSDNDRIPDAIEASFDINDIDGDGLPNHLDIDSDNDGIGDRAEGGATGEDSDGDGIDDAFDVDSTGGNDADLNGIDDAISLPNSDADASPDLHDLDSDNDGFFDTIEANVEDKDTDALADSQATLELNPIDSDNDGLADYIDIDSDADGKNDIIDSGAFILDADNDGQIDPISDIDNDGIDGLWDEQPSVYGSSGDLDNDGIPDSIDDDIDGDGIENDIEGEADIDGDGLANKFDRDSDGDGISDKAEYHVANIDVDDDGIPNYLDIDSDNDGLTDTEEQVSGTFTDSDSDHDGIDDSIDVNKTGGVDSDADGVDDSLVSTFDMDGDGLLAYLDLDTDGDGMYDSIEIGDFNKDGIMDYQQYNGRVKTGVKGGGALDLLLALLLLSVTCMRLKGFSKWKR